MLDLIIKNGKCYIDRDLKNQDIAVKDGKIVEIGKITSETKEVFDAMWKGEGSAEEIIEKKGLVQITDDSEIENIVNQVIENNPSQVKDYLDGKSQLLGYFVGQIMKETKGKANPQKVNEILKKKLI